MRNRPIRPAKGKLPPTDPMVHERLRWKAERAEIQAALDAAHDLVESLRRERDGLKAVLRDFYDAVDKAQRIDNTGGDSAVSVALWSWAELLDALGVVLSREGSAE